MMKRGIQFLIPCIIFFFSFWLIPATAKAGETVTITVSADADAKEIQAALNTAKAKNYTDSLIVNVPAGTHIIQKKMYIYSNTTLRLDKDAIMKAEFVASENGSNALNGSMLYAGHVNDEGKTCVGSQCIHGGYTRFHDITVEGGIWDRGSNIISKATTGVISLRYGRNVILRNMEVRNATEHFINVSATRNTLIDHVVFSNQVVHGDKSDKSFWGSQTTVTERYPYCEVLHLDFLCDRAEYGEDPNYNTPCRDIIVQNCTFQNVWSGIGTHHKQIEKSAKIIIRNNTFRNVRGRCIGAYGYTNLSVTDNRYTITGAKSVSSFLYCYGSQGTVSGNQIDGAYEFVHGIGKNALTIQSNTVKNTVGKAMYFYNDDNGIVIQNNQISNAGTGGIYLYGNSKAQISRNKILTTRGGNGVSVFQNSYACITDNTIQNTKNHGIYMNSSKHYGVVIHNTLTNLGVSGILIDRCGKYYQVAENSIHNATHYDVYVKKTSRCRVSDNNYYFTKGNIRYKITTTGKYVTVLGPVKKDVTSITIPSRVKKGYSTYKIKSVHKNAFKDCKKLKKILVPKKSLTKYKKLLKNKGQSKKVTIKGISSI